MIQLKRGTTKKWETQNPTLAAGQPGYDKDKKKLKIGDGETDWKNLSYTSGLSEEEILNEESAADKKTLFTYGTDVPDSSTNGKVYIQQLASIVEKDYVVETGRDINYFFRKWNSGFIECWGKGSIPEKINERFSSIIFNVKTGDYFELKGYWNT